MYDVESLIAFLTSVTSLSDVKSRESLKNDKAKEVAKEEKRARDRVSRYYAEYFCRGSEKYNNSFNDWKDKKDKKKQQYIKKKITESEYIEWLKNQRG